MASRPASSSSSWDEIVAVIGEDAAGKLAAAFGGIELYVPPKLGHHHPISVAIGIEHAVKLVDHYHGTEIYVAKVDARNALVRRLAETGRLTRQAIALAVGLSERQVYNILATEPEPNEDPDQIRMFD